MIRDLSLRFAAGAATSLVAALVSTFVGVRPAGPFLAFPAIYIAGLTLVERREGSGKAHATAIGALPGSVALAAFAAVVAPVVRALPWGLALLAALGVWLAAGFAGWAVVRKRLS